MFRNDIAFRTFSSAAVCRAFAGSTQTTSGASSSDNLRINPPPDTLPATEVFGK